MSDLNEISESTEIVAEEDCMSAGIEGESVVLHTTQGEYYGFNDVGTHVWESVQEPRTVEEICERIITQYDVPYEQCLDDLRDLVGELIERELVRVTTE